MSGRTKINKIEEHAQYDPSRALSEIGGYIASQSDMLARSNDGKGLNFTQGGRVDVALVRARNAYSESAKRLGVPTLEEKELKLVMKRFDLK